MQKTFGEFVRERRLALGLSLRAFCLRHSKDPSNWSKMERGAMPPPVEPETLQEYAALLGIVEDTSEWRTLYDLAAIEHGRIPHYILNDEQLAQRLPVFFGVIGSRKPTEAELDTLIELIRSN